MAELLPEHQLLGGDSRFVLTFGGHIAPLVNPPGNPKAGYQVGAGRCRPGSGVPDDVPAEPVMNPAMAVTGDPRITAGSVAG